MTCKHAQSIVVGKKYVKKNYLKQFVRGEGDEHNVIMVQLFAHHKKENPQFSSIHTSCKILVAKFTATFLKNKNCTTKFNEHDLQKFTPDFENNVHNKRCLRKVLQALVLNIVFPQIQQWVVCKRFCHVLFTFRNCFLCSPKASWELHCSYIG
jgi:hypothetical protein